MSSDRLGLTAILDATGPDRLLRCGACAATLIPNVGEPAVSLRARARDAGWRFRGDGGARCNTHRGDVARGPMVDATTFL